MRIAKRQRTAFTLVELLAVTVIIAILASLSTLAVNSSIQAAKEAKTRGTILKLDTALQQIFEGYEEKLENLEIDRDTLRSFLNRNPDPIDFERVKLHYIRDLMRMEMPCAWDDVTHNRNENTRDNGPIWLTAPSGSSSNVELYVEKPLVLDYYQAVYKRFEDQNMLSLLKPTLASSELLYQIIVNLNPEALSTFNESEIGDYDGNGLREFHDAWGSPIMFLRWAPAFPGSDRQPDVITRSGYTLGTGDNTTDWGDGPSDVNDNDWDENSGNALAREMYRASVTQHDPFDMEAVTRGWILFPLVYSCGADKIDDIHRDNGNYSDSYTYPRVLDPYEWANGIPNDEVAPDGAMKNGVLNHYDNIHNHRISGGF